MAFMQYDTCEKKKRLFQSIFFVLHMCVGEREKKKIFFFTLNFFIFIIIIIIFLPDGEVIQSF
ncbi:hypothetical protein L211DRAFT_284906 [Terfezia boudieri ATCC MYA-4762]|uniref:Uncharacterized protein n=1 Tax=Terfezia boudieri ATCC MYA-4762 TaxID=1051890 RepID=A0A3N4LK70_9PEZI|nr:hypothetical protein L211DRAFT_284906 [Terfezia boudieri ATCC MYA-4762]